MLSLMDDLSDLIEMMESGVATVTREKCRCKAIIKCEELLRELKNGEPK